MTEGASNLLKIRQVADELGLSCACLRSWISQRRISYTRLGRAIRIPASEIRRLIEAGYVPSRERKS